MSDAGAESAAGPPLDGIERPAATAGVVVAGLALAGASLPWTDAPPLVPTVGPLGSTPGAVLAAVAAAAFLVRRYGSVDRRPGAVAAGVASAGVVVVALVRFVAPATGGGSAPGVGAGLPLAAVAGVVGVGLAVADARGVSATGLMRMARRTATGFGLIVAAFVVMFLLSVPLAGLDWSPFAELLLNVLLPGPAFVGVALGFLWASGRGLAFLDVEWPDVRDVAYVGVGIVALIGVLVGISLTSFALGLPSNDNAIVGMALESGPGTLLVLIPLSFLVTGPAEEIFTRNVVQKYLYGAFSRPTAIVVASGIFAAGHLFSYGGGDAVATFVPLVSVFVLSLVLGGVYERTGNVVVPAFVHGFFNAVQFALVYVVVVFGDVDPDAVVTALPPW